MREFLCLPFLLVARAFAFVAAIISGRPISVDWPMTLEEAVAEGRLTEAEARRIQSEIDKMDD